MSSQTANGRAPEGAVAPSKSLEEALQATAAEFSLDEAQAVVLALLFRHPELSMFLTGNAGCGKSLTIHALLAMARRVGRVCRLSAATAKAGSLVGGTTLHRVVGIPVPQRAGQYASPSARAVHLRRRKGWLRASLGTLELLVIDEISMVSAWQLRYVDEALRLAKETPDVLFGGVQVVAVGDFLQLPTVPDGAQGPSAATSFGAPTSTPAVAAQLLGAASSKRRRVQGRESSGAGGGRRGADASELVPSEPLLLEADAFATWFPVTAVLSHNHRQSEDTDRAVLQQVRLYGNHADAWVFRHLWDHCRVATSPRMEELLEEGGRVLTSLRRIEHAWNARYTEALRRLPADSRLLRESHHAVARVPFDIVVFQDPDPRGDLDHPENVARNRYTTRGQPGGDGDGDGARPSLAGKRVANSAAVARSSPAALDLAATVAPRAGLMALLRPRPVDTKVYTGPLVVHSDQGLQDYWERMLRIDEYYLRAWGGKLLPHRRQYLEDKGRQRFDQACAMFKTWTMLCPRPFSQQARAQIRALFDVNASMGVSMRLSAAHYLMHRLPASLGVSVSSVRLFAGARIQVLGNELVAAGLYNGAMGTVVGFVSAADERLPYSLPHLVVAAYGELRTEVAPKERWQKARERAGRLLRKWARELRHLTPAEVEAADPDGVVPVVELDQETKHAADNGPGATGPLLIPRTFTLADEPLNLSGMLYQATERDQGARRSAADALKRTAPWKRPGAGWWRPALVHLPFRTVGLACTIHRVQGDTVNSRVHVVFERLWECGHAFVALSRATTLRNVTLECSDPSTFRRSFRVHVYASVFYQLLENTTTLLRAGNQGEKVLFSTRDLKDAVQREVCVLRTAAAGNRDVNLRVSAHLPASCLLPTPREPPRL